MLISSDSDAVGDLNFTSGILTNADRTVGITFSSFSTIFFRLFLEF